MSTQQFTPTAGTAIVTGASRGYGLAVAAELARRNWSLVIDARTTPEVEAAGRELAELGSGEVAVIAGDVTDPAHVGRVVDSAVEVGDLSLLVNNAGILGPSPQPRLADYPLEILGHVLEVYLIAPLRLIQLALPHLREKRGVVVNVTSDAAVEAYQGWGGYGAAKAALEQMSKVLAVEEPEVAVYWLDPGDMRTRMHQDAFPGEDISDRPLPETRAPALIRLLELAPPSGRYVAEDLLARVSG
jgi:NAD(P)-dependent dehydrogenase (short-subunit alcohol dehydrogenase family)